MTISKKSHSTDFQQISEEENLPNQLFNQKEEKKIQFSSA